MGTANNPVVPEKRVGADDIAPLRRTASRGNSNPYQPPIGHRGHSAHDFLDDRPAEQEEKSGASAEDAIAPPLPPESRAAHRPSDGTSQRGLPAEGEPSRTGWRRKLNPPPGGTMDGTAVRDLDPYEELALRRRLQSWSRAQRGVSPQDFDDLYQEAWCKLLEGERRGRRIRNREGALRWALHNSWMMENRGRRRRPTADALDSVSQDALGATNAPDPPERVEMLETAYRVCEALVPLTARQRRIVLLEIGALRPAEIQQQLGISKRTFYRDRASAVQTIGTRVGSILDTAHRKSHHSEAAVAA